MAGRCERDLERSVGEALPVLHLMHFVEAQTMDQIAHVLRHGDGLGAGDRSQRLPVQMVEVGMRHQHQIDGRQVVNLDAGMFDALDHLQPLGPVRVDQHAVLRRLHEKGGMSDPCDAHLPGCQFGKDRFEFLSPAAS